MKTIRNLFLGAVIIVAAVFAVANRNPVSLDLWPFPFVLETTTGIAILVGLAVGILVGMTGSALGRAVSRKGSNRNPARNAPAISTAPVAGTAGARSATPAVTGDRNSSALPGR